MKIDVVIPVYKPGRRFLELLRRLEAQTCMANRIIVMNTEKEYWDRWLEELGGKPKSVGEPESGVERESVAELESTAESDSTAGGKITAAQPLPKNLDVFHVTKDEFDHGATRHAGIEKSDADICVLMTDDALPADRNLLAELLKALYQREDIVAAYGRQLPDKDYGPVEQYTRSFNYPEESRVKTLADLDELGIKTYFCSNVCAAYKRETYMKLGGFTRKTIFNEDMIFAAGAMKYGYAVCYAAEAKVIHSHNYTGIQQFQRNFDLAVSQADHPEVFSGVRSEGEGIRLVQKTALHLIKNGKFYLLPHLVMDSGWKYMGYLAGKRYRILPRKVILGFTMNKNYWKGYEREHV